MSWTMQGQKTARTASDYQGLLRRGSPSRCAGNAGVVSLPILWDAILAQSESEETKMNVTTTCLKCGQNQRIAFGELSLEQAVEALDKFDTPRECPGGYHVELGGWTALWQFGSACVAAFGAEAAKNPRRRSMASQ
jgi:hypothetical protein